MLFWHLLGRENAHIRSSMLRFSLGRSFKIAIVIQFLGSVEGAFWCENLSSVAAGGGALLCATPPKIQAKSLRKLKTVIARRRSRRGNLSNDRTISKGRSHSFAPENKSPLLPSSLAQMWDDVYILILNL